MSVSENLLNEIKNNVDITWALSEDEKNKLSGMISRGMQSLKDKIGFCDFESDTQEKSLLINYVRYDRAGALSDFWVNYKGEIISLSLRNKVKEYEEENADI